MARKIALFILIFLIPLVLLGQKKATLSEKKVRQIILDSLPDAQIEKIEEKVEGNKKHFYATVLFEHKRHQLKIDGETGRILTKEIILMPLDEKVMEVAKLLCPGEIIHWEVERDEGEVVYSFTIKTKERKMTTVEIGIAISEEEE